jgi:hypothetical protein
MLVVHIGLPKTGTTFLQHRVFARAPGLTFVHRTRGRAAAAATCDFRVYARASPLLAPWYRRRLRDRLNAFAAEGRPVLLSEENISVSAFRFWRDGGATPEGLARRLIALARDLDPRLAPIKLVVGIRRQDQWLASRYAESSKNFPGFAQADFDRRMARIAEAPALGGPLGWLDYRAMRNALAAAVGPGNVHLVPLERVVVAPGETLDGIGRFLGGVDLLGGGNPAAAARKPRNRLSEGENRWRLRRDGTPLVLDAGLEAALRARFAASNRALAAEMPLGFAP